MRIHVLQFRCQASASVNNTEYPPLLKNCNDRSDVAIGQIDIDNRSINPLLREDVQGGADGHGRSHDITPLIFNRICDIESNEGLILDNEDSLSL